jgi:Flp pilus assembly pilin Flp
MTVIEHALVVVVVTVVHVGAYDGLTGLCNAATQALAKRDPGTTLVYRRG